MRTRASSVAGLRRLVRPHTTLHGATILFHLARNPIAATSRAAIAVRLRASRYGRLVPDWEAELDAAATSWGPHGIAVDDIVRYSDG
jgi:hypothetical protein